MEFVSILIVKNSTEVHMIGLLSLFVFAIQERFDRSHTATYNKLPEVEMADVAIKARPDFATFLESFGKLVRKHGLENAVGLRLVHKHFPLEAETEGQQLVMSESFELIDDVPSLVTKAREVTCILQESYPASWLFTESEEQGIPFEFSTDPEIRTTRDRIDATPGFFDDARRLIISYDFHKLLSLAILKRHVFSSNDDRELFLVERSYENLGSVIREENGLFGESDFIRTSWSFSDSNGPRKLACLPHYMCGRVPGGGHMRLYVSHITRNAGSLGVQ